MVQGTMLKLSDRQCDCGAAGCRHMKLKAQCFLAITNLNATQQLQNTQILYFNSGLVHGLVYLSLSSCSTVFLLPCNSFRQLFQSLLQLQGEFLIALLTHRLHVKLHKLVPVGERVRNSCISEDWSVISRGYCLQVRGPICYFVTYDLCSITVMISFLQKPVSDKSQRLLLKSNFLNTF